MGGRNLDEDGRAGDLPDLSLAVLVHETDLHLASVILRELVVVILRRRGERGEDAVNGDLESGRVCNEVLVLVQREHLEGERRPI